MDSTAFRTSARSALYCSIQAGGGPARRQTLIEQSGAHNAGWRLAGQPFSKCRAPGNELFQEGYRVSAARVPCDAGTAFGLYSQVSPAGLFLDAGGPHDESTGPTPMIPAQCDASSLGCNDEDTGQRDEGFGQQKHLAVLQEMPHGLIYDEATSLKEPPFDRAGQSSTKDRSVFHSVKAATYSCLRRIVTLFKQAVAKYATRESVPKAVLAILVIGVFFSSQRWAQLMLGACSTLALVVCVAGIVTSKREEKRRWETRRRRVVVHEAGHFLL